MNPSGRRTFRGGGSSYRGGGGKGYRPYYFFQRNGRVIPAHGRGGGQHNVVANGDGDGGPHPSTWGTSRRTRNSKRGGRSSLLTRANDDEGIAGDTSFLHPEHFSLPEDARQVQHVYAEMPAECPGWRLYFGSAGYKPDSVTAKRIKALQEHFSDHPLIYKRQVIHEKCYFEIQSNYVSADDNLSRVWPSMQRDLLELPQQTLATMGVAMYSVITSYAMAAYTVSKKETEFEYPRKIYARPVGFVSVKLLREVSASELDQLFCIRGSVAAVGPVEAAANWVTFSCSRCNTKQALRQSGFHPSIPYSCKREGCLAKKGFIECRSSPFTRITSSQIIRLAETSLLKLQDWSIDLPQLLDIELRHELAGSVYPGQDVAVVGIIKRRAINENKPLSMSSNLRNNDCQVFVKAVTVLDAHNIPFRFTKKDRKIIQNLQAEGDGFKLMVQSLAPEVHGHELAKAGILLSLMGGVDPQANEASDINVLLLGDPGLGKSHVLQMSAQLSARGILLSGKKGSSCGNKLGCVLRGRQVQTIDAGSVMISTRGHCALDDIDRLGSQQESLMQILQSHEVTLPYTSIFAILKCPATVVASSNPTKGHYDPTKSVLGNVKISSSLLSEFALVFVMTDSPGREVDASFTEHIRSLHKGTKKSSAIPVEFTVKSKLTNSICISISDEDDENYDLRERLKLQGIQGIDEEHLELLPPGLLKVIIAYARQEVRPILNTEASQAIKAFYNELKNMNDVNTNTSIRQLEVLIRLAQARARIDFSQEVTKLHVRDVICILRHCMTQTTAITMDSGNGIEVMNPAVSLKMATTKGGTIKKFIQLLQMRSECSNQHMFDMEEIRTMARDAGITTGVSELVEMANMQGILLKRGLNLYEVIED